MPASTSTAPPSNAVKRARWLRRWQRFSEIPMLLLSLAWIVLFVVEAVRGLAPALERANDVIWGVFVVHFVVELVLAPHKGAYIRHNWLSAVALLLPALRVFRLVRILRFTRAVGWLRGVRFVRVIGTFNRGMRALGRSMSRRGVAYVVALTAIVTLVGAAGMYAFERESADSGIRSFTDAVWWTAMIMTTMGSEAWPRSEGGRVLCVLLSLYAFAVFGYVTATLASFFVGRDAEDAPDDHRIDALREEIRALREALDQAGRLPRD